MDSNNEQENTTAEVSSTKDNRQTASFAIQDFAKLLQKRGEHILTRAVEVMGHPFQLRIYPRGNRHSKTDAEYVSIYLIYAGEKTATNPVVNARWRFRTTTATSTLKERKIDLASQSVWGGANFKRENMIRGDLDSEGTLTIEVDITIALNASMLIDSGAAFSGVPLDFHLTNERLTPNGVRARSGSNHAMVAHTTGELPLINLPKQARTVHKMNVTKPLLSLREPVKRGCIVVFGYGENNDAIICDEHDIEIIVTGSPLVTGKVGRDGLWYVSDYAKVASSFSLMLSFEHAMAIFIVTFVVMFVMRTGIVASAASAVVSTAVALAALMLSSNPPMIIDSGASVNVVPLDFLLKEERPTTNGVRVRSCSNHCIVAEATGELPLNLPKEARKAHKMDTHTALLSVREVVNQGCIVVFGYGENKDAIICDENDIEIILKKPPLVTGKARGRYGLWYIRCRSSPFLIPEENDAKYKFVIETEIKRLEELLSIDIA